MNRILIVFYSDYFLGDIKSILDRSDCNVTLVTNGKDALYQLKKFNPNLIFIDQPLPDMKTYELCNLIRNEPGFSEVPLIGIVKANEEVGTAQPSFNDYLNTPIDKNELFKTIKKYISIIERNYQRAHICIPVKYYYKNLEYCGLGYVIGEGGIFIMGESIFPVGTSLRAKFRVNPKDDLMDVEADVRWLFDGSKTCPQLFFGACGMGIQFTKIPEEGQKLIAEYVRNNKRAH